MRASRLLTIQLLLETRGRMSAQELADALHISVRTLYRDVDQLAAAGVPIYAERGRSGGFQLLDGWRTTLTGLTTAEARAVLMSGLAGPAADLGFEHAVADARLKLLAALPAQQRHEAQFLQDRVHFDPVDWYRAGETLPHLLAVAAAIWQGQQLAIRYESWTRVSDQVVHPLGLVLKAGVWYLVAAADGQPRTYRVANIQRSVALDARAERPADFDLAGYWAEAVTRFEHDRYQGQAQVLATARGLRDLRQLSAAVAQAVGAAPAIAPDERVALSIPIETIEHAVAQLLPLAPEVEVVEPPALRQALIEKLHQISRRYGLGPQKADTPCQD